jgi:stalled ribosome rescue protein Dom34
MSRRRGRRGYPLALLVGLEGPRASTWEVYSESVREGKRIQGEDDYSFYESIVDALRPAVKQGVRSVLVAAPDERDYGKLMAHIGRHQGWLLGGWSLNTVAFERLSQKAMDIEHVRELVRSRGFRERLTETTRADVRGVMEALERRISDPEGIETLLFTLEEVEAAIRGDEGGPEYILLTEAFRDRHRRRINRLLQIASSRGIKTRVVGIDTSAGARIIQLGGLVCMLREQM